MKRLPTALSALSVVLFGATFFADEAKAVPIEWTVASGGNGHFYDIVSSSLLSWGDAKAAAESLSFNGASGYLATVTSAAENSFIYQNVLSPSGAPHPWLGGFQPPGSQEPAGGWTWITGEPFVYSNWNVGEPGNTFNGVGFENHMAMNDTPSIGGTWFDINEFSAQFSLVEYNAPEVSTLDLARVADYAYCQGQNCNTVPPNLSSFSIEASPMFDGTGFQIIQLRHNPSGDIVFAVRGTELSAGIQTMTQDIFADLSWSTGNPSDKFRQFVSIASPLVAAVVASNPGKNIILTGHSLGGAVVQTLGTVSGLRTVTFNAPGAGAFIPQLRSELFQLIQVTPGGTTPNITNIRLYGDQVSAVGQQTGAVVTFDSPTAEILINLYPWAFALNNHNSKTVISQLESDANSQDGFGSLAQFTPIILASNVSSNGLQWFYDADVVQDQIINLDPPAADGYLIQSGDENPFIHSIVLPFFNYDIGFKLELFDGTNFVFETDLLPTVREFDFGLSGADQFRILIFDFLNGSFVRAPDGFIVGLTFVSDGRFTGSITQVFTDVVEPGTPSVPEPGTLAMFAFGLAGLVYMRRRRRG